MVHNVLEHRFICKALLHMLQIMLECSNSSSIGSIVVNCNCSPFFSGCVVHAGTRSRYSTQHTASGRRAVSVLNERSRSAERFYCYSNKSLPFSRRGNERCGGVLSLEPRLQNYFPLVRDVVVCCIAGLSSYEFVTNNPYGLLTLVSLLCYTERKHCIQISRYTNRVCLFRKRISTSGGRF